MWKYVVIITLALVFCFSTVKAETSLQEFLDAVPEIVNSHYDNYGSPDRLVVTLLEQEFELRFGDNASWDELLAMYNALKYYGTRAPFGTVYRYLAPRAWNLRIVERWLEQHPTDFATQPTVSFDSFVLELETHDFDNDGIDDWFVRVNSDDISDIWIARRDETQTTGYHLYTLPIPHAESSQSWTLFEAHGATLEYLGDANGDGILEMVFSSWAMLPASWTHATAKTVTVVSWTGANFGTIIDAALYTHAQNFSWAFSNVDDDTTDEFVVRYFFDDNWLCNRTETYIFDWNGEQYAQNYEANTFASTVYCDLRQAEDLARWNDYAAAVPFYESALARFEVLTGEERDAAVPFAAFAQERLILAYAFVGRMEESLVLLDEMRRPPPPDESIAAALVAIPVDELDAERMCRAAYDLMDAISNYNRSGSAQNYRGAVIPGFTDETWYGDNMQIAYWDGNAGCNIDGMRLQQMQNAVYPIDQSPSEVLGTLGISVDRTLTFDANGDATDDWLVWVPYYNSASPVIFLSQGTNYSQPEPITFAANENGFVVELPNGAEAWLLPESVTWQSCLLSPSRYLFGRVQSYTLYQYDGVRFNMLSFGLCSDTPIVWRAAEYIEAWGNVQLPRSEPFYQPAPLVWNAEHGLYEQKIQLDSSGAIQEEGRELYNLLYQERKFTEVLSAANDLLVESETAVIMYYRAVALEMLGRGDEAQQAYQHVIELDSSSVYGSLASLWIED